MSTHPHYWWLTMLLATMLAWDYTADPDLAGFLLFVRADGQDYHWEHPLVPIDVISDGLVLEINCLTLPLLHVGPWSAVVTAMALTGELSEPSNEIRFYWSREKGCQETAPPDPPDPRQPPPVRPLPEPMPDLGRLFPPVVLQLPLTPPSSKLKGGGLEDLTESCAWRGCNAPPPPPMKDPGPPLTDAPAWRGQGR